MKNVHVVSAAILMIFCSLAAANLTQVNLISQNHIVEGYVDDDPDPKTYYFADTDHVSGSTSSPFGQASSYTDDLIVAGGTSGGSSSYWAEAKSWYVFNPISDTLTLSISQSCSWSASPSGSWFEYYLKDLETSEALSSFYGDDDFIWSTQVSPNGSYWEYENQFSVFTNHTYELYLEIHADAMDGTSVSMTANLIPEPASVIMFISGLVLLKRKRQ